MKQLNPREKVLAIVTGIAVLIGVGWAAGLDSVFSSLTMANSDIVSLRNKFEGNLEGLENIYVIEKKYKAIGQSPLDQDQKKRPSTTFEEYVKKLAETRGFKYPETRADEEDIEGVDEYQLVSVLIKTEGPFASTVSLLKDFEEAGLLVRDMDIRGTRDRDLVVARVTVGRIAKRWERPKPGNELFGNK